MTQKFDGKHFPGIFRIFKDPKKVLQMLSNNFHCGHVLWKCLEKNFFFLVKILKIFFFDPKNRKNFENFIKSSKNHKTLKSGFWASRTSRKRDMKNLNFDKKMPENSMRKDSFGKIFTGLAWNEATNWMPEGIYPTTPRTHLKGPKRPKKGLKLTRFGRIELTSHLHGPILLRNALGGQI